MKKKRTGYGCTFNPCLTLYMRVFHRYTLPLDVIGLVMRIIAGIILVPLIHASAEWINQRMQASVTDEYGALTAMKELMAFVAFKSTPVLPFHLAGTHAGKIDGACDCLRSLLGMEAGGRYEEQYMQPSTSLLLRTTHRQGSTKLATGRTLVTLLNEQAIFAFSRFMLLVVTMTPTKEERLIEMITPLLQNGVLVDTRGDSFTVPPGVTLLVCFRTDLQLHDLQRFQCKQKRKQRMHHPMTSVDETERSQIEMTIDSRYNPDMKETMGRLVLFPGHSNTQWVTVEFNLRIPMQVVQ